MSDKPMEEDKKVLEIQKINLEDYAGELSAFGAFQARAAQERHEVAAMEKLEEMIEKTEKRTEESAPLKTAFILNKEEFSKFREQFDKKYTIPEDEEYIG